MSKDGYGGSRGQVIGVAIVATGAREMKGLADIGQSMHLGGEVDIVAT